MNKFKSGDKVKLKWEKETGEIISSYRTYIETRYKIKLHSDPSVIVDDTEDNLVLVEE